MQSADERFTGLLVIIPTRNRSALARAAALSFLAHLDPRVTVMISDNSTISEESADLRTWCAEQGDERLHYVRPPCPLSMPEHWQWALRTGLEMCSASHVGFSRDRSLFKAEELPTLFRMAERHPTKVISYLEEHVQDYKIPTTLHQAAWTGSVLEIQSLNLLRASAQITWYFYDCLPRMLNCIVPRGIINIIEARFGNVFSSIAPDVCFAYRCLETTKSIFYYDKALNISYAMDRSNGTSQVRGLKTGDHVDFLNNLGGKKMNFAAPVPNFQTVMNAIVHEYCFVRNESGASKFPEININNYLSFIASEIPNLEDAHLRTEMEALLEHQAISYSVRPLNNFFIWRESCVLTSFDSVEAALKFGMKNWCKRSSRVSYEEKNIAVSLVLGGQPDSLVYLRVALIRGRLKLANWMKLFNRSVERHLLWRLRS